MVKKAAKMLKKLNKSGIKFDGKKKFFTSSRRKPISKMDYFNCGELGHLAHQCKEEEQAIQEERWQEEGLPQEEEEWKGLYCR